MEPAQCVCALGDRCASARTLRASRDAPQNRARSKPLRAATPFLPCLQPQFCGYQQCPLLQPLWSKAKLPLPRVVSQQGVLQSPTAAHGFSPPPNARSNSIRGESPKLRELLLGVPEALGDEEVLVEEEVTGEGEVRRNEQPRGSEQPAR